MIDNKLFIEPKISFLCRKNKLYVKFTNLSGKEIRRSLGLPCSEKSKAKKYILPALKQKILNGEFDANFKVEKFSWYAAKYLKQKENIKSYQEFENLVKHQLLPVFGNMRIDEIKRGIIKEWLDKQLENKTPKTVAKILGILRNIFHIAIEYEHIKDNPASNIKLPSHKKIRDMQPFSKEEVSLLIENAEGFFKNYLAIAFFTGMRPGEIIALTLSDISLDDMYINVNKRVKKGVIDTPKTKNSIRKVPIPNELKPYLEDQIQKAKEAGVMTLFFTPTTKKMFYDADKLDSYWKRLLKKVKMPYRVKYNTRHTFASLMIQNNVPIHIISQTMGHKNIQETLTTYAKFLPDENLKIDRNISIFGNNSGNSSDKIAK
jgi:integrase